MISFKGRQTSQEIILQSVCWYCAYALSYRNIEEMMAERGVDIDHSTLNRWVVYYALKLEKVFHQYHRAGAPASNSFAVSFIYFYVSAPECKPNFI